MGAGRGWRHAGMPSAIGLTIVALAVVPSVFAAVRCLTPDTSRVLQDALATGAVQRRLPDGFAIENVEIASQRIALTVQGTQHARYEVTLQVAPSTGRARLPGGHKFTYAIADTPEPPRRDVAEALLAAAALLDDAVPESVLVDCSGPAGDPGGRTAGPEASRAPTLPPALALASAIAEVLVVVGALLFGLATIGRPPGPDGQR